MTGIPKRHGSRYGCVKHQAKPEGPGHRARRAARTAPSPERQPRRSVPPHVKGRNTLYQDDAWQRWLKFTPSFPFLQQLVLRTVNLQSALLTVEEPGEMILQVSRPTMYSLHPRPVAAKKLLLTHLPRHRSDLAVCDPGKPPSHGHADRNH
jgi:hypothetical protein